MPHPDRPTPELDEGTWQQPAPASPPTHVQETPPPDSTSLARQGNVSYGVDVANPLVTPTPSDSRDSKDSADPDERTPKPGPDRSHEWDLFPPPIIEAGQTVFGKYLLEKKLGEGGMGEVWLVEYTSLERESALKLIKQSVAQNDKGWKRFAREARVMAKLKHPNLVDVYAAERTHSMGYIEMEYVRGQSLDEYLKEQHGKPMPLEWIAQILDQLCSALQHAHTYFDEKKGKDRPIIHRDLKPSNLMLVAKKPQGQNLKVLDFGIAKMVEDEGNPELTGAGDLVGTPAYMSPEQIRGGFTKDGKGEIDGRSDLYSVGVMLYQFLTGSVPFKAANKLAVVAAHLNTAPPPMKELNPNAQVPLQVERLVMSCLEKDPNRRPQSARELAEKFRIAAGLGPIVSPWRKVMVAASVIAGCAVIAASVYAGARFFRPPDPIEVVPPNDFTHAGTDPSANASNKGKPPETTTGNGKPASPKMPGYEAIAADRLKAIAKHDNFPLEKYLSPDVDDAWAGVKRESDGVEFYCFRSGIYLPVGYYPDDAGASGGFWPKVLVRNDDGKRFIRISGGKYLRGDFTGRKPVVDDLQDNPCLPHEVKVSAFYIQESEVTNDEIAKFLRRDTTITLDAWQKGLEVLTDEYKKTRAEIAKYPAVFINWTTAQAFAGSVKGRLPTEAEWEYAARSSGLSDRWAGNNPAAKNDVPKAWLLSAQNAGVPVPLAVKSLAGKDETDQKVFDMTGNVREWCLDRYRPYSEIISEHKKADPANADLPIHDSVDGELSAASAQAYVVRGGSFQLPPGEAQTFQRNGVSPDSMLNDLGFRVVIQCPRETGDGAD